MEKVSHKVDPSMGLGFNTMAIHCGIEPETSCGAVTPPIYFSSNYIADPSNKFCYQREGNPTRDQLEKCMCALEKAKHTQVLPSGNAGGTLITHLLKPGDHILALQDMYGGLIAYFDGLAIPVMEYKVSYVDFGNKKEFMEAFTPDTKMVWMESPSNPLLKIYDIAEIAKICKEKGVLLVFDNTFLSPYLMNPLDYGVDIVLHSGTKYIGGHSDILMGFICTNNDEIYNKLEAMYPFYGACPAPFDCFLAIRGLKTLSLRMERAQSNATKLAEFLLKHPKVEEVFYPGLPSHIGYEIHKKQARGPGAMLSFKLKGCDLMTCAKFCLSLHLFTFAGSLGGVEGLICTPANFTHGKATPEFKKKVGVTDNLIRVSVGIDDYADIEKDFTDSLKMLP